MLRTHFAKDLKPGKVKVAGWVHEKRPLGGILFVILRDFTGLVQVIAKRDKTGAELLKRLESIPRESVVSIEGKAVESKNAPNGIEVIPETLTVLAEAEPLPIDISPGIKTGLDKRLDFRSVDLRKPENLAIFKVQSMLMQEMQSYLKQNEFMQIFTPSLMGVASESGSEVFSVVYFDKEAFLRQDPQLHRQLSVAGGLERIYEIGPSWRAEQSHTVWHMCEHRTIAVETAFIEDEYDVIQLENDLILYAMEKLQKDCKKELRLFNAEIEIPKKIPILEFPEIYDVLDGLGEHLEKGEDLNRSAERKLGEFVKQKYKSDFFFVNKFPFKIKPFYVMRDGEYARSVDLVFKGMEMSSGGQREHRYEKIMEQAKMKDMNPESVKWFADCFRWGVAPHGGFSIGIERMTMQILGLENIREATLFPRDTERLLP
ncbi:MAG: aspartate--tRNA(Asn) ligase [Candidatus Aenigmarchaeota archaeon]|nr:aspartate--tRNA(Asn) ligase [Candidatus Aenigmarchaeota archaeon]